MKRRLAENPGAVLQSVLSKDDVEEHCRLLEHMWRERIFTPLVTLWTFLWQVLDADGSCRQAVARTLGFLSATVGLDASHDPSAYCKARRRLPEALLPRLARSVAEKLIQQAERKHLWHGRQVKLVDGSSVAMWDSVQNAAAYPQPEGQKAGCGFPVARIVAVFDLVTGAVVDLAMAALSVSERALFHQLWDCLEAGQVLVGDRYYGSYADIALLRLRGVDVVFRLHQARKVDWRRGRRLGPDDRLVEWHKEARPKWMSPVQFEALAPSQQLRLVRFSSQGRRPWRAKQIMLVTTLLDAKAYPARDIAELYGLRWEVETDLGHLKTTMKMEFLRTRTPQMIKRELWAYLLAYNLVRTLMWQAALRRRCLPIRLSFKGAIQQIHALWPFTATAGRQRDLSNFYEALLRAIGAHPIPHRPKRAEPRVRKRRPHNYRLMTKPRQQYRQSGSLNEP
jgi:IS4 transposase